MRPIKTSQAEGREFETRLSLRDKGSSFWNLFKFYRLGKPKACLMARYPLAGAEGRGIVHRLSL